MLALYFIVIGINIILTSATQEPSSVSSSQKPALERTRVVTPKNMSASVAKKIIYDQRQSSTPPRK